MYVHVEHYVLSGFQLLFHLRFQGAVEAVFVDFLIFQEFTVGDALAELFGREEEIFHPVTAPSPVADGLVALMLKAKFKSCPIR